MSQLILQTDNQQDLMLLLSLVKRLDIKVVAVNEVQQTENDKLALMQQAANDPLFLADVETTGDEFKHVDSEQI